MNKALNVLVLFSYGSLTSIDDVAGFYNDIFHGHGTEADLAAGVQHYESHGRPDPLGANTNRIGRALTKRLKQETGEEWKLFIANHHALPSIETVAKECAKLHPKRIATFGLTPFDSVTGNSAYEKKFKQHFNAEKRLTKVIHIPPYCENREFIEVLTDRAQTAYNWLSKDVHSDIEIIFTIHSMPGIAKVHEKMIKQYETLAKTIAHSLDVDTYHIAYRSGQPNQRWLDPDVLDVVDELGERNVRAVLFVEALSVIANMEVLQEITEDAVGKAQRLGMKAVQSEYLNDSTDFINALEDHLLAGLN